jgi:lysozyme family protein
MALPNAEKLTSQMAMLPDAALKQMAMMHKNDPYVLPLIISEDGRRKQMRQAAQAQMAAPQSKVADAALAQMGQLPEEQGIGALPAPNMQSMADGGIAGYGDGDDVPKRVGDGMAQGGMYDFAQRSEPVVRMAGGGYVPSFNKTGAVNAAFEDALQNTLKYEGGYVADDAGKGPSNFGINKSANPDVDIKGLTKDKARELYKKRYWDVIGGDALAAKNPALAKVAFDTAVNLGPEKAKAIIAQAKDDPAQILKMRQEHYNSLLETNPNKFGKFEKSWNSRMADLATKIIPSAEAGELPKPTATAPVQAQPEKAGLESTDAGRYTGAGMSAATMGAAGLQSLKDVFSAGFKPGTTASQAGRVLGTAAVVPQAVLAGGQAATEKAMSDLQYMSPEQRRQMSSNPMLSAMSGDAGLASAIMDAAANNPEGPSKMPYKEQMVNVGKALLGHPDIERQRLANEAKRPAKVEDTKPAYNPEKLEPVRYDEFGPLNIGPGELPKTEEKAVVDAAKEATPAKERKGFSNDDLLTLGLNLLASKSPNFMTALGEAGLATVAGKKEREKMEREEAKLKGSEELQRAQAKYYGAYAGAIERGAKEKNDELEAEKLVRQYMGDWEKNNKITALQDPTARLQEEARIRQQIYTSLGLTPIMSKQASPASQSDPLGILNKR